MAWHRAAAVGDLEEGEMLAVTLAGQEIALYLVEGRYYATDNICTHAFACLSEGVLEGFEIECPLHQGIFDVRSGEPLEGPVEDPLRCFPVKIEGGEVLVEV